MMKVTPKVTFGLLVKVSESLLPEGPKSLLSHYDYLGVPGGSRGHGGSQGLGFQ